MSISKHVGGSKAIIDNLGHPSDHVEMFVTRDGTKIGPVNLTYGDVETVPDFSELEFRVKVMHTDFRVQNVSRRAIDLIVLDEQPQDRIIVSILRPGEGVVIDSPVGRHYRVIPAHLRR